METQPRKDEVEKQQQNESGTLIDDEKSNWNPLIFPNYRSDAEKAEIEMEEDKNSDNTKGRKRGNVQLTDIKNQSSPKKQPVSKRRSRGQSANIRRLGSVIGEQATDNVNFGNFSIRIRIYMELFFDRLGYTITSFKWLQAILVIFILSCCVFYMSQLSQANIESMGFFAIKFSAIPAVALIMSVGMSDQYLDHLTMAFLLELHGSKNERITNAMEAMFSPIFEGGFSTILAILLLGFSSFEFVVKYFFLPFFLVVIIGLLNGLVFLPVVLSLIGPSAVECCSVERD